MGQSTKFREQHGQILRAVKEITPYLTPEGVARNSKAVRLLLSKMAGLVNLHLAMEDEALYPALHAHSSMQVRATAKRFVEEMGGIKAAFVQYLNKWPTPTSISANPEAFIRETNGIFEALASRIAKENDELYPLFD
jgi:hypothetical protein